MVENVARPKEWQLEPAPEPASPKSLGLLLLALKTLSQRMIVALAALFSLLTVGSVFWVWMSIPSPNPFQLISMFMYAMFVLAINWIVRRPA